MNHLDTKVLELPTWKQVKTGVRGSKVGVVAVEYACLQANFLRFREGNV